MKLVTVLVNRDCGHCLRAVEQVERLARRTGASVAAMDLTAYPETAARLQLKSSPAVLFENGVAYPGVPEGDQFDALAYGELQPNEHRSSQCAAFEQSPGNAQ